MRQHDRAIEQLRKTFDLDSNYADTNRSLGLAYEQKGEFPEAIAALQKAVTLSEGGPGILADLGHAYGASGKRSEAQKVLDALRELSKRRYVSPYSVALVYVGLGQKDTAMEWLQKAYEERSSRLIFLRVEPRFDLLRSDPRFADLLRRVGLSP